MADFDKIYATSNRSNAGDLQSYKSRQSNTHYVPYNDKLFGRLKEFITRCLDEEPLSKIVSKQDKLRTNQWLKKIQITFPSNVLRNDETESQQDLILKRNANLHTFMLLNWLTEVQNTINLHPNTPSHKLTLKPPYNRIPSQDLPKLQQTEVRACLNN